MILGLGMCGRGWELFLNADIPAQIAAVPGRMIARAAAGETPVNVGRYTVVCDGATMASVVEQTIGVATQLDRAMGYEANASGTSYLSNPLGMLDQIQVAAPLITVTANRSEPAQLATVKWDTEGVVPESCTLVTHGIWTDFQTTREQAAWLAPYYSKHGRAVRSHGYAAAEDALAVTMQHMPNLALEPSASAVGVNDLIASVKNGVFITSGVTQTDHQARNGTIQGGDMRQITNGRLGKYLTGGVVQFNTTEFWKNVTAVGGAPTQVVIGTSGMNYRDNIVAKLFPNPGKGQPGQITSHSVSGVAAMVVNQPFIDLRRKA
jgi:TldD protein